MRFVKCLAGLIILLLASCTADQNEYNSTYQCYFNFNATYHPASLLVSCINTSAMGTFCSVTKQPGDNGTYKLNITLNSGQNETLPITTAEETRQSCILGSTNGLIIGRSTLNAGELYAFDLMCPNCMDDYLYKKLSFANSGQWVTCSNCKRSYDLNNRGVITSGESGKSLIRYRSSFVSDRLIVTN